MSLIIWDQIGHVFPKNTIKIPIEISVCVILGDPRTDQSGLYDLYTSNPTLRYTITVGIRRSLLIFQNHIFEGFDEIFYIYAFF